MKVQDLLSTLTRGEKPRLRLAKYCYIRPVARYKLLTGSIRGKYAELSDEVFVFEFTNKHKREDKESAFFGSHAARHFSEITNQKLPPFFNPCESLSQGNYPQTIGTKNTKSQPYTQYNKELYDSIMIFYLCHGITEYDLEQDNGNPNITNIILTKLSWNGEADLHKKYAKAMNTVFCKFNTDILKMNNQLQSINPDSRVFEFPTIRKLLENEKDIKF